MSHCAFKLVRFPSTEQNSQTLQHEIDLHISGTINIDPQHIVIDFHLAGDTMLVKYAPPHSQAKRRDQLWKSTCFELFARRHLSEEYWEYNMSPSNDWNVYHFQSYRFEQRLESLISSLRIHSQVIDQELVNLKASLPLPPQLIGQSLDLGVCSVIEDNQHRLHYYALTHPGDKPDFHDPHSFIVSLTH